MPTANECSQNINCDIIGCKHQDYCADMTRTVFYGERAALSHAIYEIVLQANLQSRLP